MDRKAGVSELHEALMLKADARETMSRAEMNEMVARMERLQGDVSQKMEARCKEMKGMIIVVDFEEFDDLLRKKVEEMQAMIAQKSNIKDVCALLDTKSSRIVNP